MEFLNGVTWQEVAIIFALCAGGSLVGAIALLLVAARQIADVHVPEDADFFETLRLVPITVPLALDLLDMAFDIFAAPISWIVLELLGLKALQTITMFEGIIPGTQLIPTMTLSWGVARLMGDKQPKSRLQREIHDYRLRSEDENYERLRSGRAVELQDNYRARPLLPDGRSTSSTSRAKRPPAAAYPDMVVEGDYEEYVDDFDEPPPDYYDDGDDY